MICGNMLALDDWRVKQNPPGSVPSQGNCNDCGMFMCLFAQPFKFTQRDIGLARRYYDDIWFRLSMIQAKQTAV